MSVLLGIVILGLIIWVTYGRYVRVLARKRYAARQHEAPDLSRFSDSSPSEPPRTNGPEVPGST
jgi:hypothetical protein